MFLKLTTMIINTHQIRKIIIQPNKYYIHMIKDDIDGTFMFASGRITSDLEKIEVCKEKHHVDYYRMANFIEKIKD